MSLPSPTDDGRTYTFRLRTGIRYSNGGLVKPSDVRSTFERDYRFGKLFPVSFYDGIVGAARCKESPKRCLLSRGIVANNSAGTVIFHLVAPDPEFMYQLALPFGYIVPTATSARETKTRSLPGTGPYVITNYRPHHGLTLVRNRFFREWSKAAQPGGYPDRIAVRLGGSVDAQFTDATEGKADLISTLWANQPSQGRLAAITAQHAGQVHTSPVPATTDLFLNTRLAPFDRLDVRQALNYAVDRAVAVRISGGPDQAEATCQILPPNFPGYRPYCPYTAGSTARGKWTAPDLPKARALIARSGTRGMQITVWTTPFAQANGLYTARLLRSLGYRTTIKSVPNDKYFSAIQDSRNKAQIGFTGWSADYPAASNFVNNLFTCASFTPDDQNNSNPAEFCNPRIDREVDHALAEQATNPQAAQQLWTHVDRQIVDQAPGSRSSTTKVLDVLSKRVGNYQFSPAGFGPLVDQLWVH